MSDQKPLPDEPTDPLDGRPASAAPPAADAPSTVPEQAHGPPEWTNQPDVPEPFDPPAAARYRAHSFHRLGGCGRVWRAHDTELKREVAFKEIRPKFAHNAEVIRRFIFEAEVTGRLDHPAVIPVYGLERDAAGKPCYAMRFVEGKSLQEKIDDFHALSGPSGAERALELRRMLAQFVTVCRAVHFAHTRGVIHRDLKPQNILVGDFGETLVVDWGVAKRVPVSAAPAAPVVPAPARAVPDDSGHSVTGELIGTANYWAPEQWLADPDRHNVWTDVYGLGSILFAILTGRPPNRNGVPSEEPPSPQAGCPWVDPGIDAVVRTALAFDPAGRYPSAAAVAEAVEVWLADQPLVAQRTIVAGLERATAAMPGDPTLAEQYARQRANLGQMLAGMGRHREAVAELKAAADAFGRLAESGRAPRFLADQASLLMSLSRSYKELDRPEMTRAMEQKATDLCEQLGLPRNTSAVMLSGSFIDIDLETELQQRADEFAPEAAFADDPPRPPRLDAGTEPDVEVLLPGEEPAATASADTQPVEAAPPPAPPAPLFVPTDSVPDLPELPDLLEIRPPRTADDSGVFELTGGELAPVPVPPPDAAPDADDIPDVGSLSVRAMGKPPPAPGTFLSLSSGYTRLRELPHGAMSRLYLARDENLKRVVVIKTLPDGEAADSRAARRFRREVQITGSLEHPNLVRAYASGTADDGRPYLVLEYLSGGTLVQQLDAHGPGWGPALLGPLAQACDGIHFAHSRGIVHRDAKLSNIVVMPQGRTVLLDWGLGKVTGQQDSVDLRGGPLAGAAGAAMQSREGAIVGTPAYMSPEQARGDASAVGPRADVFTFGANLFHLVTGKPPGYHDDLRVLVARRAKGLIPRLREARPDVPRRLDEICSRATAPRPEDRHPTAAVLAAELRVFLAGQQ